MAQSDTNFEEDWRSFLQKDAHARNVVLRVMQREGLAENEVLSYLLRLWADRDLPRERVHSSEQWMRGPLDLN